MIMQMCLGLFQLCCIGVLSILLGELACAATECIASNFVLDSSVIQKVIRRGTGKYVVGVF